MKLPFIKNRSYIHNSIFIGRTYDNKILNEESSVFIFNKDGDCTINMNGYVIIPIDQYYGLIEKKDSYCDESIKNTDKEISFYKWLEKTYPKLVDHIDDSDMNIDVFIEKCGNIFDYHNWDGKKKFIEKNEYMHTMWMI